jgi:hypothetical protein
MFAGVTAEGINREVASMLEAALVCRRHKVRALATIEFALWNLALQLKAMIEDEEASLDELSEREGNLCRGILPSLRYMVKREFGEPPQERITDQQRRMEQVPVDLKVGDDENSKDYYCHLCRFELANMYHRCRGGINPLVCALCCGEGQVPCSFGPARYRLIGPMGAHQILQTIERKVGNNQLPYSHETEVRLRLAQDRFGRGHEEKLALLAKHCTVHQGDESRNPPVTAALERDNSASVSLESIEPDQAPQASHSHQDQIDTSVLTLSEVGAASAPSDDSTQVVDPAKSRSPRVDVPDSEAPTKSHQRTGDESAEHICPPNSTVVDAASSSRRALSRGRKAKSASTTRARGSQKKRRTDPMPPDS